MANEKDLWRTLDRNLRDALGECKDLNGLFKACNIVLGSMREIIGGRKDLDNKKPGVGVRGMKDILSGNGNKFNCGCESGIKFLSEDGESISTEVSGVNFGNFCDCLEAISKLPRGGFLWIGSSALSKTTQRLCKDFEAKAGKLFVSPNISGQNQGQAGDNKNAGGGGQNNGDANPVKKGNDGNVQQPPQQKPQIPVPNLQIPVPNPNGNVQQGGAPVPPPPLNLNANDMFKPAGTVKLELYREKFGNNCDKILAKLREFYKNGRVSTAADLNKGVNINVPAVIAENEWYGLDKKFTDDGSCVEYFGCVNIDAEEGGVGAGLGYYFPKTKVLKVIGDISLFDIFEELKGEVETKMLGAGGNQFAINLKKVGNNGQGGNNKGGGFKEQLKDAMNKVGNKDGNKEKLKRLLEENRRLGGELWKNKEVYGEPGKWEKVNEMKMLFVDISKLEKDNNRFYVGELDKLLKENLKLGGEYYKTLGKEKVFSSLSDPHLRVNRDNPWTIKADLTFKQLSGYLKDVEDDNKKLMANKNNNKK